MFKPSTTIVSSHRNCHSSSTQVFNLRHLRDWLGRLNSNIARVGARRVSRNGEVFDSVRHQFAVGVAFVATAIVTFLAGGEAIGQGIRNWELRTEIGPDAKVPGFYFNLGTTGLRVLIPDDEPTSLEVAYVFADSPAHGQLEPGDRILGVGERRFETAFRFGYGMDFFGYEGPLEDFANELEDCYDPALETSRLKLDVRRDNSEIEVVLTLPTRASFSKTYPFDCERSDQLQQQLLEWLVDHQQDNGVWSHDDRPNLDAFAMLALLGSGNPDYLPNVERAARYFAAETRTKDRRDKYLCWHYSLYGIALAEYYLATREEWVLSELQEIHDWLCVSQGPRGGWGHQAFTRNGENGYGPICMITSQAMLAMSLMEHCGIEIDHVAHRRAHKFITRGTNAIGYVWYADESGGEGYADMGRTGGAALAHALGMQQEEEWSEQASLHATCIGRFWKTFPDTHGSPILGVVFTALGAAVDDEAIRSLLDNNKWFFVLSECEDGSCVYMPNRDGTPQDYAAAPRLSATAAIALVLALKDRQLYITGKIRD